MHVHGLLLAAGSGIRYGGPKALVPGWLSHSVAALREGGCEEVLVVLGAGAEDALKGLPRGATFVIAEDWESGLGASLRTGLDEMVRLGQADAALVHLVDLPDVGRAVIKRVLSSGGRLARASYDGTPGHPVLLAREHWAGVMQTALGDKGGRDYLVSRRVVLVECGDIATGRDVDRRGQPPNNQPTHS
jgi:CTP:molybdopterin cytidylyltransferase MocA